MLGLPDGLVDDLIARAVRELSAARADQPAPPTTGALPAAPSTAGIRALVIAARRILLLRRHGSHERRPMLAPPCSSPEPTRQHDLLVTITPDALTGSRDQVDALRRAVAELALHQPDLLAGALAAVALAQPDGSGRPRYPRIDDLLAAASTHARPPGSAAQQSVGDTFLAAAIGELLTVATASLATAPTVAPPLPVLEPSPPMPSLTHRLLAPDDQDRAHG